VSTCMALPRNCNRLSPLARVGTPDHKRGQLAIAIQPANPQVIYVPVYDPPISGELQRGAFIPRCTIPHSALLAKKPHGGFITEIEGCNVKSLHVPKGGVRQMD
jgi:hypothetical protein